MTTHHNTRSVSRRTALAGLAGGGVGMALFAGTRAAQDAPDANHPMVGAWLVVTVDGPAPAFVKADGSFLHSSAPVSVGPDGAISYPSPQNGVWEPDPDNERGIHFTTVQNIHDATGTLAGTLTVDGYPIASEDGQSFHDDGTRVRLTFRDASNNVTMVLGEDGSLPPVIGNRMVPGAPDFPEATPAAATPAS
jgi:hypothetical protein